MTSDQSTVSGMEALLRATLQTDDRGCVVAQADGTRVALVWPDGYRVTGDSASFEIVDATGAVVARSGTPLAIAGGGADSVGSGWGEPDCATARLWMVGQVRPA